MECAIKDPFSDNTFTRRIEKWFTWREKELTPEQLTFCGTMALCFNDDLDLVRLFLNTGLKYGKVNTEFTKAYDNYLDRNLHHLKDIDL